MQAQRRTAVSAAVLVAAIVTGVGGVGLARENFSAVDVPPARAGIVIDGDLPEWDQNGFIETFYDRSLYPNFSLWIGLPTIVSAIVRDAGNREHANGERRRPPHSRNHETLPSRRPIVLDGSSSERQSRQRPERLPPSLLPPIRQRRPALTLGTSSISPSRGQTFKARCTMRVIIAKRRLVSLTQGPTAPRELMAQGNRLARSRQQHAAEA